MAIDEGTKEFLLLAAVPTFVAAVASIFPYALGHHAIASIVAWSGPVVSISALYLYAKANPWRRWPDLSFRERLLKVFTFQR